MNGSSWAGPFAQALRRIARDAPDRVVLHVPEEAERRVTRERLWARVVDARAGLRSAGLSPGDVVLWMAGNASGFYSLLAAAMDAGVVLLLADQATPPEMLGDLEAAWAVAGRVVRADTALDEGVNLPGGLRFIRSRGDGALSLPGTAVIKLTSGSAGTPRGVTVTEAQLWDDVTRIVEAMEIGADDVHLACIPITHSYGLGSLVLPALTRGCPVVLRSARRPRCFAEDVGAYGVTTCPATPHIFDFLLERHPARVSRSLRLLISAGAPLRRLTVERALEAWALKIHSFYGTTETGGIAFDGTTTVQEDGYVGHPLPRTAVELAPWDSTAPGTGRIVVRSGSVGCGYVSPLPLPENSDFGQAGFTTSDIGATAADGGLRLLGRITDAINVAGLKVDPAEVETVLRLAPGVSAAFVVGVPCSSHGQDVVALLAAQAGVKGEDVAVFCRRRLSRHKVPRSFVILDRLPLTRRGKVDRAAVDRHLSAHVCRS